MARVALLFIPIERRFTVIARLSRSQLPQGGRELMEPNEQVSVCDVFEARRDAQGAGQRRSLESSLTQHAELVQPNGRTAGPRIIRRLGRRLAAALGVLAVLGGGSIAASAAADDQGAVVIEHTRCALPDAQGGTFTSNDVRQFTVITPSGRINHYCHGALPADRTAPQHAVRVTSEDYDGGYCVTPGGGATQDWQAVITPSGTVSITCNGA
jgi:hypothetical protein